MIQDSLYETVFGPKDVVLPWVDPNDLYHFSTLNSELYKKYHKRYYAENMWIFADGPATDEIELCFERESDNTRSAIRNVTLRWTSRDIDEAEWSRLEPDQFLRAQIDVGGAEGLDNWQAFYDYSYARKAMSAELGHIWISKAMKLHDSDLYLLVLDATTAYGLNGEYIGVKVAKQLLPRIHGGFQCRLEVWAPIEDLANQIYDIIVAKNVSG